MRKNVISPATLVASSSRPIASRISGNAGSTLSMPSAVTAIPIARTNVNIADPDRMRRRPGDVDKSVAVIRTR